MTVSKALRDEPDVSAATRAKIKSLASQMGYVPDFSAQGLRTKTTKLFGLVIPATTNPIYARIVYAIEERAFELGYDVLIAHTLNRPEREEQVLRKLLSRRVDGLFITPVYRFEAEARIYNEIAARKIPNGYPGLTYRVHVIPRSSVRRRTTVWSVPYATNLRSAEIETSVSRP